MSSIQGKGYDSMRAPIVIEDYNPDWPLRYEYEKAAIVQACGHILAAIEHIGSTAVPGLAAKPIIDIMGGLRELADATQCIGPLASIGYAYVPEYEVSLPERRYFRRGPRESHIAHLHMVETRSDFWHRHLLFRDYLRAHPATAQQYAELKRVLAAQYGADRDGYTEGKTAFIRWVEATARAQSL